MLREQEFKKLHHAMLHVLERVGLHIPGEEILTTLQDRGFPVDRVTQTVKLPPDWVEDAVIHAPKEIRLYHTASDQFVTLGKASLVYGMGVMDSANTYSFKQLVIDDEMISAVRRVHEGVLPNMLTEELPLVEEIGWSGNYMISDHTLKHYLEYWRPALMTRKSFDQWAVNKKPLIERMKEKADHLLNNAPPLVLKENLEKELREILAEHRVTVPAG